MVLLGVVLLLAVIGSWILGVVGFFRAGRALRELDQISRLRHAVDALAAQVEALRQQPPAPPPVVAADAPAPETEAPIAAVRSPWGEASPAAVEPEVATAAAPLPAAKPASGGARLEATLTLRWGVWLGAVALLLAGVFLIRYAIDQGLLGPATRCGLAALLGLALVGAAEMLRRAPRTIAAAWGLTSDHTLPALAGAGVAVLFAAAYGAGVLYAIVPPVLGFAGMAAAALAGLAVSLRYGQVPAAVGVAGAFVTPLLVGTDTPSLPGLFAYLLAVTAAALAVMRYSAWTWLGWAAAGAGALWVIAAGLDLLPGGDLVDGWAAGLFVAGAAGLNLALLPRPALKTPIGRRLSWVPFAGLGLAGLILESTVPGMGPRAGVMLLAPIAVWKAIVEPRLDRLPWLSAALSVAVLLLWALPDWQPTAGINTLEDVVQAVRPGSWAPQAIRPLLVAALLLAGFHAAAGLAMERRAPRPLRWSALAAAMPVVTLGVTYAQVTRLQGDVIWAFVALLLAGGLTAAASAALREGAPQRAAVHGAGATGALALGLAMILHEHWLTMALSLMLPPLAWIEGQSGLAALRRVVLALAAIVLVRLVPNWYVLDYDLGRLPVLNGLIAAYGVPAACFAWAGRALRRRGEDGCVALLEAGATTLATLLAILEIRHWATGGNLTAAGSLLEVGLQLSALWIVAVVARWRARRAPAGPPSWLARRTGAGLAVWTWRVEGGLALLLGIGLVLGNPLLGEVTAGSASLAFAYALPALLAAAALALLGGGERKTGLAIGGYAVLSGLVWATAEIRVLFHGDVIGLATVELADSELWAISGAWLAYGAVLLAVAIVFRLDRLRPAALGIVALTALKVFVVDMSDLAGLWRVLSFLGLGLSLIGVGAVYRRFVLPSVRQPSPGAGK
jgi:uncharacterized membrane protein